MMRWWLGLAAALAVTAAGADAAPRHGLSVFGDLKYPPDFQQFDYVDPNAPKGGEYRSWALDSFDTLNPFLLKGVPAIELSATFDTLMARAMDEPDALYGLIAETADVAEDR